MKISFLVLVAAVLIPFSVQAKSGSTQPGSYSDWHDVDEVTIVQPFHLANYKRVLVQPLDTSKAPLPPAKDNSYSDVKTALATSTDLFVQGLRQKLGTLDVQTGQNGGANSLLIRARIIKSDPGSQAARYWGSFGAGAVKVGIAGEIIDGATNKVLVRFTQERRSGFGAFGGGYRDLLHRTIKQIGGDVAGLLRAF
jgi:hypothetical protein